MKGVAILFIVLHNLLHWISQIKENEFSYSPEKTKLFFENLVTNADTLWMDVFSFLGWYGVATFLFLSGYGLVKKYEQGGGGNAHVYQLYKTPFSEVVYTNVNSIPVYRFLKMCIWEL